MNAFSSRSRSLAGCEDRGPVAVDVQARALGRHDERQHVPAAVGGDAALEAGPPVQPLEHRQVRVGLLVVAVDARVGEAREHLVVAGVGEPQAVRDPHAAPARGVAQDLALAGHDRPDEGQQRLAARLRGGPVETGRQRFRLADAAVLLRVERGVVPAEQLLPAEAVEGHDQDIVDRRARRAVCRPGVRREPERGQHQRNEHGKRDLPLTAAARVRHGLSHASCSSFISAAFSVLHSASSRARVGATASRSFACPTSSR